MSGVWFVPSRSGATLNSVGLLGQDVVVELSDQVIDLVVPDHRPRPVAAVAGLEVRADGGEAVEGPRDGSRHPDLAVRSHPAQGELLAVEPGAVIEREPGPRRTDCRCRRVERAAGQLPAVLLQQLLQSSLLRPQRHCAADGQLHRHLLVGADLHRDARVAAQVPADVDDAVAAVQAQALCGMGRLMRGARSAHGDADRGEEREHRRNDERARGQPTSVTPCS